MNIYIYGSKSFKKEIQNVLEHANIKFKLDADSVIKNIDDLDELKDTIEESPNDIYLIEDDKIIKRNSLNSKMKFLTPKDGIEEDFLLEHSIPDLTIDSLDELPKYIIKKHDEHMQNMEDETIADEIQDIVDDAYANEESNEDLDDELTSLLVKDDGDEDPVIDDFSDDGLDEYKFEENIEPTSEEEKELLEENEEETQNNESFDDIDLESHFGNIDDLMDDETNELPAPDFDDSLNLDELETMIEDKKDDESSKDESFDDLDLDELDSLMDLEKPSHEDQSKDLEEKEEEIPNEASLDEESLNFDELEASLDNNEEEEEVLDDNFFEELENNFDEVDKIEEINDKIDTNETIDSIVPQINLGDENMSDDFSQLDQLNEADLLKALDDTDIIVPNKKLDIPKDNSSSSNSTLEVSSSNINDLTKVFSELLKNKTIEITIKIKD